MTDDAGSPEPEVQPQEGAADPAGAGSGPGGHAAALADELMRRIDERTARVVVVGQGYVGLPVAMRAVEVGFPVVGLEASVERAGALGEGRSYVNDVSDAQLRGALAQGYRAVSDPADVGPFDIAIITVPTPLRDGGPDLSYVEEAAVSLSKRLRAGSLVVLESTTYPGTTEELVRPILEGSGLRAGEELFIGYSPERIDPGNPHSHLVNTPKVVSGIDETSLRCVTAFYSSVVDKVVPVGSTAEAEMTKLLENTFRHVNIALVNELAMFATDLGIDIWSAIDAAASKPFGFMRFTPGPGVGGHCLPIDPSYLSWRIKRSLGRTFRFIELANDVNEHMPDYVVTRVVALLNGDRKAVNGSRILALGLSYKAGTSDWRESPSLRVIEKLLALGAHVRACEPYLPSVGAPSLPVSFVDCTAEEIAAADIVVVLVDHPDFSPDLIAEHAQLVLDAKGFLRPRAFRGETL